MLNKINQKYKKNDIGLYRDDGIAVFKNVSGPESERIKKNLQSIFKESGLDLVIECNKKVVDFLDVTLNLNDGTYRPFHKQNSVIQYINVESNHPPNIIKQVPKTIEKRLSDHSSSEKIFKEAAPAYEKALKESGYDGNLKYNPTTYKCNLCLNEKLEIALYEGENILNKRTELISKCRHVNKFSLLRHDSID
eukprot:gene12498-13784_t